MRIKIQYCEVNITIVVLVTSFDFQLNLVNKLSWHIHSFKMFNIHVNILNKNTFLGLR